MIEILRESNGCSGGDGGECNGNNKDRIRTYRNENINGDSTDSIGSLTICLDQPSLFALPQSGI